MDQPTHRQDTSSEVGPGNPDENAGKTEVTPEAPKTVEPKPVEVSPADQSEANTSDAKTDNILGADYTISPDRGYRRS